MAKDERQPDLFDDDKREQYEEGNLLDEEEDIFTPPSDEAHSPTPGSEEEGGEDEGGERGEEEDSLLPKSGEGEAPQPQEPAAPATPPDEMAQLREQNQKLLERLQSLEGRAPEKIDNGTSPTPTTSAPASTPDEPSAASPTQVPTLDFSKTFEYDFIGDEDIDDIVSDKGRLNAMLARSAQMGAMMAVQAQQQSLPLTVRQQIQAQSTIDEIVKEFYTANSDLNPVKRTVGAVTQEIAVEHGDWTLPQILEEAAKKTRELLGLPAVAVGGGQSPSASETAANPTSQRPALPSSQKGGKRPGSGAPLTGQAKHIGDVL